MVSMGVFVNLALQFYLKVLHQRSRAICSFLFQTLSSPLSPSMPLFVR